MLLQSVEQHNSGQQVPAGERLAGVAALQGVEDGAAQMPQQMQLYSGKRRGRPPGV